MICGSSVVFAALRRYSITIFGSLFSTLLTTFGNNLPILELPSISALDHLAEGLLSERY